MVLTDRDRETILMVYNYDSCGYAHVYKRLFSNITYAKFYQRMRELIDNGYLVAYRCPALSGIGSGKNLLNVGRKGFYELHDLLGKGFKLRRPRHLTRAIPADHQHGICDFRVDLELGASNAMVRVSSWTNERELRGKPDRVPDAEFVITDQFHSSSLSNVEFASQRFRLEVDRGTIDDAKRMTERLKAYTTGDDSSPALWVVPDQKRAAKIKEWTLAAGGDTTIIWITLAGNDPLSDCWEVVGGPSNARLTP